MNTREQPGAYKSHQHLIEDASRHPEIWRLFAGLALVAVVVVTLNAILFATVVSLGPPGSAAAFLTGSSPFALLIVLASFIFATLGVALGARLFQHRSLSSIVGNQSIALRQFWRVLRALLILSFVILALPPYDLGEPLLVNLGWSKWLLLLPLSLGAVFIQTSAEEILFRGYLQQSLAARFRSPVIWMGLPSILFAAGHYSPATVGDNAILISIWALTFGLLTADLTARAGTLGPAIALHFFNNFAALLVISLPDNLGGLALFHLPYEASDADALRPWLFVDFALMVVGWLTARLVLRR
ncbi:CPBP family intramembrane metalloprotease (plasmid) [Ruegeria conchae]|uniref:CPBP family intramembrane glutamic endopeptidase n=1 Tax=Ruegeria conchae TaxID=981384 RepID=UPI00147A77DF|nr:type II CAAX endopeptidase family protein [Ruegeria conchae]UWR05251.1 CPBP family intramembrane metalloprotease [Ruegeria conchae]